MSRKSIINSLFAQLFSVRVGRCPKKFSLVSVLKLQFSTFKLDPFEKGFRQNTDLWQKISKFNIRNGFIAHQL